MQTERPVSAVLRDIVDNVQDIVRAEMRLAKTEVTEELGRAGAAGILVALGAVMLMFCMLFALLAVVYALSLVMPTWAAAAIVALVEGVSAAVLVATGVKRFRATRAAPRTRATVKENVEWAKQLTR
jgi:uncharacterized membrane protein YqjE